MSKKALMLVTVSATMRSPRDGLLWPSKGKVVSLSENGIQGLLWGEGDAAILGCCHDSKWLVCQVKLKDVTAIKDWVTVPKAKVVHCGDRKSAIQYLLEHGAYGKKVAYAKVMGGDNCIVVTGYSGKSTVGDNGIALSGLSGYSYSGYRGVSKAGAYGTATAGDQGEAIAGDRGKANAGALGVASVEGYGGESFVREGGTAKAGEWGKARAGCWGSATTGLNGRSYAERDGTAQAGKNGMISIEWYDGDRYRLRTGSIGEDNLLPDTLYQLDRDGNFIPAGKKI